MSGAWKGKQLSARAVGSVLVGLLVAAALPTAASASQARAARAPSVAHFVLVASSKNTGGDTVYINNRLSNGNRHALVFVTPNWNPHNSKEGTFDTIPVGVWYNGAKKRWGIFNEDGSTMAISEAFNVLIFPKPTRNAFVQTATAMNTEGDLTFINRNVTNRKPGALLQVTQNWDPPGNGGFPNDHPTGVYYDRTNGRWSVFEEDQSSMPTGPSFNVLVGTSGTGARSALLKSTARNIELDYVRFKNRRTDNDFKAEIFATPVFNPGGSVTGNYMDSAIGVFYHNGANHRPFHWAVFRQDQAPMTAKEGFNLLYYRA